MKNVKIKAPFAFAHHGYEVREYSPADTAIPDDAAEWAIANGIADKNGDEQTAVKRTRKLKEQN